MLKAGKTSSATGTSRQAPDGGYRITPTIASGVLCVLRQSVQVQPDETVADLFGATDALALLRCAEAGALVTWSAWRRMAAVAPLSDRSLAYPLIFRWLHLEPSHLANWGV